MSSIKTALLVLCAFAAGYLLRDQLANNPSAPTFSTPGETSIGETASGLTATGEVLTPGSHPDAQFEASRDLNPSAQVAMTKVQEPSAEVTSQRIKQLVDSQNYDGLIALLRPYVDAHPSSLEAWFYLARAYEAQGKSAAALDAWYRYLRMENDSQRIDFTKQHLKKYLLQLAQNSAAYGDDSAWMIKQLDELLTVKIDDGELHLAAARLYVNEHNPDQAQYHALMALNDPQTLTRAQEFLARLNGSPTKVQVEIPLARMGSHFVVTVNIEGRPARLLLDTGASLTGVSNLYIDKNPTIVKSKKTIRLSTANGSFDSYFFSVDSFSFGEILLNHQVLTMINMESDGHIDGLFGMDILGRFDYAVDQDAAVLRLSPRK